jgi:tripartite-type tricarboxylate transporter receptor subunit TctC
MLSLMQRAALLSTLLTAALMMLPSHGVSAEGWPSQSVHLIVPASPGSSLDVVARIVGERLALRWNRPVVVEAKAGAGGMLGMNAVAKAPADGYTLGIGFNGPISIAPHLYRKMAYDPGKDLRPIVLTTSQPNVLAVPTSHPAKTARELVEWARQRDGGLLYASVGNGSSSHLTMELLKTTAGVDIVHVPFNGSPPAVMATIQGETQMLFAVMQPMQAQIQAGKLRAIAVTTAKRFPLLPDLPTVAEAGYPGFEALAWNGILVAARTPRPIIARLNTEINAILKDPAVKSTLNAQGFELVGGSPEDFANLIRGESEKWAPVIRKTGAKID